MTELVTVYRYLDSDAALKTLVNGEFKVGKISQFNDPFEWQFGVGKLTPEDFERIERVWQFFRQWRDSKIGILCFSKTIEDPVLWSLYAEKHHGVAFELRHSWTPKQILHMSYSNQRPQLDVQKIHQIARGNSWKTEFEKYNKPIIACFIQQKSKNWGFERECRLTVHVENPARLAQFTHALTNQQFDVFVGLLRHAAFVSNTSHLFRQHIHRTL